MLDEAYASAISGKHKDPEMFLDDYCRIRLGLARAEDIASVKAYFNCWEAKSKLSFTTSVDAVFLTPHELHKSNNEKIPVCIFIDFLY